MTWKDNVICNFTMIDLRLAIVSARGQTTRVSQGVGGCRGGNRNDVGCEGFQLKMQIKFKFLNTFN